MKRVLFMAFGLAIVIGVAVLLSRLGGDAPKTISTDAVVTTESQSQPSLIAEVKPSPPAEVRLDAEGNPLGSEVDDEPVVDAWVEELPEGDRKLGQAIVDASDNDDLEALRKLVDAALSSSNPAIRERMVESLSWFGKDAVAELARFLMDKDTEVAQSAFTEWDSAVDQIDSEEFGITVAVSAMKVLTDEDNLQCVALRLEGAEDRKAALNAIAEIAESGNEAGAKAAREAYEFITGEDWPGSDGARAKALVIDKEDEE